MSICTIFNKSLRDDAAGTPIIDTKNLSKVIPSYNSSTSGIWKPLVVYSSQNKAKYCDPLIQAGLDNVSSFDPCNCSDAQITSLGAGFYSDYKEANLDSSYCGAYSKEWKLYDADTGQSSEDVLGANGVFTANCSNGACDVRFKVDDFIAKVPVLNQSYISGFYDFKHLHQFPACTNEGLGFERFVEFTSLTDIDSVYSNFCVDWKLKPVISEIPYEASSSYHLNEYTHNKSSLKADKVSRTCGNFILTEVAGSDYEAQYSMYNNLGTAQEIPSSGNFTEPYGFTGKNHNNLFIGGSKLASHWKWNVTSGILGWYRYYDKDRVNDQRPVPGVDLYISQGDVFWATTDGPEPDNPDYDFSATESDSFIKNCPSGLKVVDGSTFKGIVPNGSEAVYISNNIYPKFYQFYERYLLLGYSHKEAFRLGSIMATSPLYDGYTVDLLHPTGPINYSDDQFNEFGQIDPLNKDMLVNTKYESIAGLNYISNTTNLVDTLYHKYGGYLWIPPQTNETIKFNLEESSKSVYFDMDFDMVIDKKITERAGRKKYRKKPTPDCSLSVNPPYSISYNQRISAGSSSLSTNIDSNYRYNADCIGGVYSNFKMGLYANVALNNNNFANKFIFDGATTFSGVYSFISENSSDGPGCAECGANSTFYLVPDAESVLCTPPVENEQRVDSKTFCYSLLANFLNNSEGPGNPDGTRPLRRIVDAADYDYRRYKSLAFNPHIDLVAFHEQGGAYFNSSVFGENKSLIFDSNVNNNNPDSVKVQFYTKDAGIKIYSFYVERLQTSDTNSLYCKRFPVDVDNACKCYGLNLSAYTNHPYSCIDGDDGPPAKTYSSVSFYVPNLSTVDSPKLQYYGGYTPEEVKELFGITVQEAGSKYLPNISDKLDPENPYACPQSKSIQLGNYTVTNQTIRLDNFSTSHADIYVSVSETADYTSTPVNYQFTENGEDISTINPNWKRFVNKVVVGDTTLYNNQKKILYSEGSSIPSKINLKIVNPYLVAIMGGQEEMLKPPNFDQGYAGGGVTGIFGGRGDELSTVTITFEQKPRKQLLTFKFNPQQTDNLINFVKSDFDPEHGLISSAGEGGTSQAILDDGRINYAGVLRRKAVDENDDDDQASTFLSSNILRASLTDSVKDILNSINFFDLHRKPRLYLQKGGCWYIAKFHNRGGFNIGDTDYIGKPRFYEYTRSLNEFSYTGCLLPGIPKKPIALNSVDGTYTNVNRRIEEEAIQGERIGSRTFRVPGASAYFRVKEKRKIHNVTAKTIEEYASNPRSSVKFKELISLKDSDGYFLYIGPERTDLNNYIFIGENPNILENRSNLDIDYTEASSGGIVYNTEVNCGATVQMSRTNAIGEGTIFDGSMPISNTIVKKRLVVKFYNDLGKQVPGDAAGEKTIRIFTEFDVVSKIHDDYNFIAFAKHTRRTLLWDQINTHTDHDILLDNELYKTKWGDLIQYDGFVLNNPFIPNYLTNNLPKTPYNNLLYKMIVNDGNAIHKLVNYSRYLEENAYFYIRQKYSLGNLDESWDPLVERYQNYIPVIEVNTDNKLQEITADGKYGFTYHSSLFNIYNENETIRNGRTPDVDNPEFFITDIQELETAYMPDPDSNFYTETFRVSNPLFWLDKTIKEQPNRREGRMIIPSKMDTVTNSMTLSCFNTETIDRESAFYREKVLSDMDSPNGCDPQRSIGTGATCLIKSLGDIELKARFKIGKPRTLSYEELPDATKGFISYEGGLYNPLGDSRYTQIVRTELPLDNPIDTELTCSTTTKTPKYNKTLTSMYQNYVDANQGDEGHSTIVKNMDIHANEMLFRILYGEKTPINKEQLFVNRKPLTKNDLIGYVAPEVKAKDLYNEILYNYDKKATAAINATGSYTINGMRRVGDTVTFSIGNVSVSLSIVQSDDDILIEGNIGSEAVSTVLYRSSYIEKSLIRQVFRTDDNSTDPAPPEPSADGETISLVSTREYLGDGYVTGSGPPGMYGYVSGPDWNYYPSDGMALAISNPGRIFRTVVSRSPCHPGTQPGDPFNYGYCRIDEDAENCTDCELFEEKEAGAGGSLNVQYSFEDCSKKFTLFGHSYRDKYVESDAIDEELPDEEEPSEEDTAPTDMDDSGGVGGNITYGCHPESMRMYQATRGCGSYYIKDDLNLKQKVYIRTKTRSAPQYSSSACPGHFFTVNFTNKTLTIVLPDNKATLSNGVVGQSGGSKTYCVDLSVNGCPSVSVNLPAGYTVSENLNTSCDVDCSNDANIIVPRQSKKFSTKTYTAVCVLGHNGHGNIHGGPGVEPTVTAIRPSDGRDDFGRAMPPCYGNSGHMATLCDGSGAPWIACHNGKIVRAGAGYRNGLYDENTRAPKPGSGAATVSCSPTGGGLGGPTSFLEYTIWKNGIIRSFNNTLGSTIRQGSTTSYVVGPFSGSTQACQVVTDIPEDEIFEGVVPGSCELKFYDYTKTYGKVRQAGINNTQFGSFTMTYTVAYIQYKYKTTATITSTQSADDGDSEVVFNTSGYGPIVSTNNPVDNCEFNQFPDRFLKAEHDGYIRPSSIPSYITTTPVFSMSACDSNVSDYNSYDDKQTICNYDDWQCWAANNSFPNWNASVFLNRQRPKETWV